MEKQSQKSQIYGACVCELEYANRGKRDSSSTVSIWIHLDICELSKKQHQNSNMDWRTVKINGPFLWDAIQQ